MAQENTQKSVKVTKQDIVSEAFYHGEIGHLQKMKITSQVSDEISQVNINVGDEVMKGDILIQFSLQTIEQQINHLNQQIIQLTHWTNNSYPAEKEALRVKSILLEKELDFEENSKRSTIVALRKAYEEQIASLDEIKEAENDLSDTLSHIKIKRAEQKIKEALLEGQKINNEITISKLSKDKEDLIKNKVNFTVKAPFNGTIIAINSNLNDLQLRHVEAREFLFTIVNQNSKTLNVTVPESEVYKLVNEKNNICYIPRNNIKLACHLYSVSLQKSLQGTDQYIASYELSDNNEPFSIGETAEIHLKQILKSDALAIPVNSLVRKDDLTGVMLFNEGEKVFTPVTLGVSNSNYIEILSGLQINQEILLP